MKSSVLLLALGSLAIGGCTSAYKTGQTPDDVYFSPERPMNEYVQVENRNNRYYEGSDEYYEDRYLRMKVSNRTRWNTLDDYYFYNRYNYRYNNFYYNNPWNPYNYWNHYYNPYNPGIIVVNPKTTTTAGPRRVNLNAYNNNQLLNHNTNSNSKVRGQSPVRIYGNTPSRNNSPSRTNPNSGRVLRDIFNSGNSNNNNNNSVNTPSRASSNNNSSSSGSKSSSTTAPRRKF